MIPNDVLDKASLMSGNDGTAEKQKSQKKEQETPKTVTEGKVAVL